MNIYEKHYKVYNPLIKEDLKYVCLSDIHSDYSNLLNVVKRVLEINPDFVLITGDLIDYLEHPSNESFINILTALNRFIPVYISYGNHDTVFKCLKNKVNNNNSNIFKILKENGLTILDNDNYTINDSVILSSINLPCMLWYVGTDEDKNLFKSKLISNINQTNKFRILMSHTPNPFFIGKNELDEELTQIIPNTVINSGHNHGGLISVPLQSKLSNTVLAGQGLIGPYSKVLPINSYGSYIKDTTSLIMSDGVTRVSNNKLINSILGISIDVVELHNGHNHKLEYDGYTKKLTN